jgi:hypothetical protein
MGTSLSLSWITWTEGNKRINRQRQQTTYVLTLFDQERAWEYTDGHYWHLGDDDKSETAVETPASGLSSALATEEEAAYMGTFPTRETLFNDMREFALQLMSQINSTTGDWQGMKADMIGIVNYSGLTKEEKKSFVCSSAFLHPQHILYKWNYEYNIWTITADRLFEGDVLKLCSSSCSSIDCAANNKVASSNEVPVARDASC